MTQVHTLDGPGLIGWCIHKLRSDGWKGDVSAWLDAQGNLTCASHRGNRPFHHAGRTVEKGSKLWHRIERAARIYLPVKP